MLVTGCVVRYACKPSDRVLYHSLRASLAYGGVAVNEWTGQCSFLQANRKPRNWVPFIALKHFVRSAARNSALGVMMLIRQHDDKKED